MTEEPADGALVAFVDSDGEVERVYVRDDKASAGAGDFDPNERWFTVGNTEDDPSTWADLYRAPGGRPIPLFRGEFLPTDAGVTVRHEWGVHSTDGNVYTVIPPTEGKAMYEATLLYNGVPGSAEDTPEPGCAPASRYVMTTPQGEVATGWHWPCSWTPPPAVAMTDTDRLLLAADLVVSSQLGSQSMLQRNLGITFGETVRVMDRLAELGVVGPQSGTRARDVLVRPDELPAVLDRIKSSHAA